MAFTQIRPIKAIFQPDGEVILGEFTDIDYVSIINGGTGAQTKEGARANLELLHWTEFDTYNDFDSSPDTGRLAKSTNDGKLYYSHNNVWLEIGKSFTIDGTDGDGTVVNDTEITKFIFGAGLDYVFDPVTKTGTITLNVEGLTARIQTAELELADLTARVDVIEGDENTEGSIRYLLKQRFDELLGGVIPELDTLKEIADSLGDTLNFRSDFDTHVAQVTDNIDALEFDLSQKIDGVSRDQTLLAQTIDNFQDIDITTNPPQDGNALVWDNNIGQWVPGNSVDTINNFDDVDTETNPPQDGLTLVWNSTLQKWVPGESFNLAEFEDAFNQKSGADLLLGNASDGSFSDGALNLQPTQKTTDAIDDLNEALDNIRKGVYVKSVSFSSNPTSGGAGTNVTLSLTVDGTANRYDIDWGDGQNTTNTSDSTPSHTYTSNENSPYTVTVRAFNTNGSGAGSEAFSTREDYIIIYTTDPTVAFRLYRNSTGGSPLSGNNLWVVENQSLYLENISTETQMADVTYKMDWGDGSANDIISSDNVDGGVLGNRLQHTWNSNSSTGTGRDTLRLTLDGHSTANPSVIPRSTTETLKVYEEFPSAPQGLSSKTISFVGSTGYSPRLASGFTDNTTGTSYSAGSSVSRTTATSGRIESSVISTYAYDADAGTLSAIFNGNVDGDMTPPSVGSATSLNVTDESDYNLLNSNGSSVSFSNSIYYPNLYTGFKAKFSKLASGVPIGVNNFQLTHSTTGSTNLVEFVKDDLTSTASLTDGTLTEKTGNKKYISGIPYYTSGSVLTWSGLEVSDLVGQTYYNTNNVVEIYNGTNYEGTSNSSINTQSYDYLDIGIVGTPAVNTGVVTPYSISDLDVNITSSSARTIETIRARAHNVNGAGNYIENPQKIAVHTATQYGINEQSITVSQSLGDGFNDYGKRIFDFASETINTPPLTSGINYYTNNPYTESADPGVEGTQEASIRLGVLKHSTEDYSTFLPVGPNRSGDTGTQYFTFAFRRTIVANFNINISSSGINGLWIAAPGTTIDDASDQNGWLDCSIQYAGAGVPGGNTGSGGNGSDGCASTGADRILPNTNLNGSYTMTLGTENLTNATNNVCLVRIALASGQSVNSISIT